MRGRGRERYIHGNFLRDDYYYYYYYYYHYHYHYYYCCYCYYYYYYYYYCYCYCYYYYGVDDVTAAPALWYGFRG